MDYNDSMPEQGHGAASSLFWGELLEPGTALKGAAIRSALINPAAGAGLFSFPGMAIHGALNTMGAKGTARALSPVLSGYFDFNGVVGGQKMSHRAIHYWRGVEGGLRGAEAARFMPGGRSTDKMLGWLTNGTRTLKHNRLIMGMISRETSLAGGVLSRAGLRAGLEAAGGLGIGGVARFGMWGISRALGPIGWGLFAYDVIRAGYGAYKAIDNAAQVAYSRQFQETAVPFANGYEAQTQRRQALMTIQQSRMNARSAFGHEAKRFHM